MLAIHGGDPVRTRPFPPRRTMHEAERDAAVAVVESEVLSGFFGSPGPLFVGGDKVREFEAAWSEAFGYRHAVTVNSWSTGLSTCVGALDLEPGDQIVCSPYTMSASATSALFYGVVPVFADIDPDTYCLDPTSAERVITDRTRAIAPVHLFGHPAAMDEISAIAQRHGLRVIEDAAQAPMAAYHGRFVGALADIGGFSLNYHKHIHTGEGGVIVTDDDRLAARARLIRNHGENAVETAEFGDPGSMIGSNYRLTEIQAAIGIEQLRRLAGIVALRQELADHLSAALRGLEGIRVPSVPEGLTHSYYVYPIQIDENALGVSRSSFVDAVNAELPVPKSVDDIVLSAGYATPLYDNRIYQRRSAMGSGGFPFNLTELPEGAYEPGSCPVTEQRCRDVMLSYVVRDPLSLDDISDVANAITKVVENASALGSQ